MRSLSLATFPQSLLAAESTREGEKLQNKRGFPIPSHVFPNASTLVLAVSVVYNCKVILTKYINVC